MLGEGGGGGGGGGGWGHLFCEYSLAIRKDKRL